MIGPDHQVWGSAHGPIRRLSPNARLTSGAAVFAVCLISPATGRLGLGAVAITLAVWTGLVRPPLRIAGATLVLGLTLFLPYYLLTPLIETETIARGEWQALRVPTLIAFKGMSAMLSAVFTLTAVSMNGLRRGIGRMPLPAIVKAITIQIVHQSATLYSETTRIAHAMAVRGGTSGYRTAFGLIVSLPRVWLPRIVDRAERVGDAMTVRGFGAKDNLPNHDRRPALKDRLVVAVFLGWLVAVIAFRIWGES